MANYNDLKSVGYIDEIITYAEHLLGIRFHSYGENKYASYCPFHSDRKDSFRVYVNGKDEVRFRCFGQCEKEWDIYDLIMIQNQCRFKPAQFMLAEAFGIKDFDPYDASECMLSKSIELEEQAQILPPKKFDENIEAALIKAMKFYHDFLMSNSERFSKVIDYLNQRGLDDSTLVRFKIGYAPALPDDDYYGRALLDHWFSNISTDHISFSHFVDAGLFRLLDDETVKGYWYYRNYIDFSYSDPYRRAYADYFAGRMVFPILDIKGNIHGFVGRRPDNRGIRWIKQRTTETAISTKGWLFGIDKAARWISHYRTVIIVEGIFDYFAFYRLFQDTDRPLVVSTLGTNFDQQAEDIFTNLGVQNYIVAYDWDDAGKNGITRISEKTNGQVFYMGGLQPDEDPGDKLKDCVNSISGFSLNKLMSAAAKMQNQTERPVMVSVISRGSVYPNELILKPHTTVEQAAKQAPIKPSDGPEKYFYEIDGFLPLLTYNHGNKAALNAKIQTLIGMLNDNSVKTSDDSTFHIYARFIREERYDELGSALILWLRLVIEQQLRKRRVKVTDSTIADWLDTSRQWVSKNKKALYQLGYLKIDTSTKIQKLSVQFSPK